MSDLALKDIISFCEGRMKLDIDKSAKAAYRDVKFLARQHLNILQEENIGRTDFSIDPTEIA